MKVLVSWSSGKDSAWMLHKLKQDPAIEIGGLLTTMNEAFDRVAMHAVRRSLVEAQARAAGVPLRTIPLPWPCTNEEYEARMRAAVSQAVDEGFTHVAFGDLFLEDVRAYREGRLAAAGKRGLFPLWGRDTADLASEFLDAGFEATVVCVDPRLLDASSCGRRYDELLAELPPSVDPCGENGEFHTFVSAGPIFAEPIVCKRGEIVEREGFFFCDLTAA
jgi:uncharacterized protein (TIGR00290 family)